MTKANNMNTPDAELYPSLAAYVAAGGELRVKCSGGIWYVTVVRGDEKRDLSVTMASRDLAYGLRQADMASRSWVMA